MRRFSIAGLMLVIALAGVNLALLHSLLEPNSSTGMSGVLLAGLLPLANSLAIALGLLAARWRVALRRRPRGQGTGRAGAFAILCGPILAGLIAASLISPQGGMDYANWAGDPMGRVLNGSGIEFNNDVVIYAVLPAFLFLVISGPPLLLVVALATILSRFQLVVTPRETPCDDPESRA